MRLIQVDKNKYDLKKYRFVVRKTNSKIITQITYATPTGDRVICEADSSELKRYGLTAGLTNYAASYATGLLCGRRLLTDIKLNDTYKGVDTKDVDGNALDMYKEGDIDEDRRPFKVILDLGLNPPTTGNRVFGAMKGISDAGVYIPHRNKRFPGHKIIPPEEKGDKAKEAFDPEVHKNKIFGVTIQEYMEDLKKEEPANFKKQFSQWEKSLKTAGTTDLKALYTKVHAAIRKDPSRPKKTGKAPETKAVDAKKEIYQDAKGNKFFRSRKLTKAERQERINIKLAKIVAEVQADA